MVSLRRQRRGECDYERLWLLVMGGAAASAAGWLALRLPTPVCLFHRVTGLPCPTCGGTRCVNSLLHGDAAAAVGWNPLAAAALFGAALYCVYALLAVALKLPRVRLTAWSPMQRRSAFLVLLLLLGANWVYLLWRLQP